MPLRGRRLIRIASDARTGARINRFHEQVDAVAVEATSNSTALPLLLFLFFVSSLFLSLSLFSSDATTASLRLASLRLASSSLGRFDGIVDTFIGQVATARIVSGKKPITLMHRKNASAAKLRAVQLKSDG